MASPEQRKILAVCNRCGYVLCMVLDGTHVVESPYWTKHESVRKQLVKQARSEFRRSNLQIKRVSSCEVCRGEYYISALASAG